MHMQPVLAGLHPHTQLFTHIQIETGLGPSTPTSRRAGTLIFFLSLGKSALWYEFGASWASPLDIVWEDQREREPRRKCEAFLSSAQRDYRFTGTDKCNFFSWILMHLHQGNGSAMVDLACVLSSKKWKKLPCIWHLFVYSCMGFSEPCEPVFVRVCAFVLKFIRLLRAELPLTLRCAVALCEALCVPHLTGSLQ